MNISLFRELNYVNPSMDRFFKSLEKLLSSTFCTAVLISLMQVLKNEVFLALRRQRVLKPSKFLYTLSSGLYKLKGDLAGLPTRKYVKLMFLASILRAVTKQK